MVSPVWVPVGRLPPVASVGLPVLLSDGVLPVVSPFPVVVSAELSFVVVSCCGAVVVSSGCGEVGFTLSSALTG